MLGLSKNKNNETFSVSRKKLNRFLPLFFYHIFFYLFECVISSDSRSRRVFF
jgi:hypothetical protein